MLVWLTSSLAQTSQEKKGRGLNEFPKGKYRLIWHHPRGGGFPALKECEGERGGAEKTEKKEKESNLPFLKVPFLKKHLQDSTILFLRDSTVNLLCSILSGLIHLRILRNHKM